MFKKLMILAAAATMFAATDTNAADFYGTLAKIKETGTIVLGHRESSVPFAYIGPEGKPIGYSMDLCMEAVEAMKASYDGTETGRFLRAIELLIDQPLLPHVEADAIIVRVAERMRSEAGSVLLADRNIPGGLVTRADGSMAFETHDPDGIKVLLTEA